MGSFKQMTTEGQEEAEDSLSAESTADIFGTKTTMKKKKRIEERERAKQ